MHIVVKSESTDVVPYAVEIATVIQKAGYKVDSVDVNDGDDMWVHPAFLAQMRRESDEVVTVFEPEGGNR